MKKNIIIATCLVLAILLGVFANIGFHSGNQANEYSRALTIGNVITLTIGPESALAAVTPDYQCDGVDDNVQFQAALDALPANGGKILILGGQYNFSSSVTRAIDNVVFEGVGYSSYFVYNGAAVIFTAGGNRWVFEDIRFDAGYVDISSSTDAQIIRCWDGATYYAFDTNSGGDNIALPVGRGSTFLVAASNASSAMISQADYICDGVADNVQINAAITALGAIGGKVLLSEGTFRCNAVITASDEVIIEGMDTSYPGSASNTWILSTANPIIQLTGNDTKSPSVKNLTVRGDTGSGDGIVATRTNRTHIENVNVLNCGDDGIIFQGVDFGWIKDCAILNNTGRGVSLVGSTGDTTGTPCANVRIEGCDFGDSETDANLLIGYCSNVYLSDNHFEYYNSTSYVPNIYMSNNSNNYLLAYGNTIASTGTVNVNSITIVNGTSQIVNNSFPGGAVRDCIEITGGGQQMITDNNIGTVGRYAIEAASASQLTIDSNTIYLDKAANAGNFGILTSIVGSIINNNHIQQNGAGNNIYAIWVTGNQSQISNNTIDAVTNTGFNVDANECVITDNIINGAAALATLYGMDVEGDNNVISGNVIEACANGILIRGAGSDDCNVIDNQLVSNTTAILNQGTSVVVRDNVGFNLVAAGTPTGAIMMNYYNSTLNVEFIYDGSAWQALWDY